MLPRLAHGRRCDERERGGRDPRIDVAQRAGSADDPVLLAGVEPQRDAVLGSGTIEHPPPRELLDGLEDPLGGRQQVGTWHRWDPPVEHSVEQLRSSSSIGAISLTYAASRSSYDGRVPEPKDLLFKVVTRLHRAAYDLSHGKVGGTTMGMPVLKLTTVGRKSGERRTTMLTSPLVEGDDLILVASFGGDDRHPAWYLNLVANPDVDVEIEGSKRPDARERRRGGRADPTLGRRDRRPRQLRRLPEEDRPRDPGRRALAALTISVVTSDLRRALE